MNTRAERLSAARRICLVFSGLTLSVATITSAAHSLHDPVPFHLSPGDHFRIEVTGGTFASVGVIQIQYTPVGGGPPTTGSAEDIVPNVSVGARVPDTLAVGQYTLKLLVSGTPNDPADPKIWVRQRPFRFIAKPPSYAPFPATGDYKDTDFGDVDNDGFLDIFQANSQGSAAIDRLLINQLGSTPSPSNDFSDQTATKYENSISELINPNDRTYDADLVDLDLDGDLDLVRVDRSAVAPIRIFLNAGNGTFTDRSVNRAGIGPSLLPPLVDITTTLETGPSPSQNAAEISTGDVDGDSRPDLLLSNWAGSQNALLLNRLSTLGRFVIANTAGDAFSDPSLVGLRNRGGGFGNFNHDTRLDIIFPTIDTTASDIVLINNGNNAAGVPQFTVRTDWVKGPAPGFGAPQNAGGGDLKVADLDGDGDDDVVVGSPYETKGRILWNDNGTRLVELDATRYPVPARAYDVEFGDLDRDGDIDIIFAHFGGGGEEKVLINRGGSDRNMKFEPVPRADLWFRETAMGVSPTTPSFQLSASFGDYDLDGDLDLVTGGFSEVRVWKSDLFDQLGEDRDWVFVLDRTRSMISGGKDFFAPSKNAIVTFLGQRRPGDDAGLVTYDYTGATPLNSSAPDNNNKAQVESQVGVKTISTLQTDVSNLMIGSCSGYCTSIGWAIKTGKEVAEMSPDPDREKVVVLLTDGRQNQSPHPDTIIPTIPSNIRLYTIALGAQTDDRMLSALATNGGKFYFAGRSSDYASVQSALRDVDNDIEAHATGKQSLSSIHALAWSPTFRELLDTSPFLKDFTINLVRENQDDRLSLARPVEYFFVDPEDRQVRFTLNWRHPNDFNRMELVDPKGRSVLVEVKDLVRERRGSTFHVVEVADPLSGVWRVRPRLDAVNRAFSKLTAMASSDLRVAVEPQFPLFYVGERLSVDVELNGSIVGVRGEARILSPRKVQSIVTAQVSENQGLVFRTDEIREPGSHQVEVVVLGPPERPFVRTWRSVIHVAKQRPDEPDLRTAKLGLDRTKLIADGRSRANVTLQLLKIDGTPLTDANVTFVSSGAKLQGRVKNHGNGTYSQALTSGTRSGDGWVQARVGLVRLPQQVGFTVLPGSVDPQRSSFEVLVGPLSLCSNQKGKSAIRVVPVDGKDNPMEDAEVEIEKTFGSGFEWAGPVERVGASYLREFHNPGVPGSFEFVAVVNGTRLEKTAVLQVFDPGSPEGIALGCSNSQ